MEKQVLIIGAGVAGSVAAGLLRQQGHAVTVLEKGHFPRFVIGESLLPAAMPILEAAGFLPAVEENATRLAFQFKNGAAFTWQGRRTAFDFRDKFTPGAGTTYQVKRANFDALLIAEAEKQGARVLFGHTVTGFQATADGVTLQAQNEAGEALTFTGDFVLDASGYGRVLPRLLQLDRPSILPPRQACFTHIRDHISAPSYEREKILIAIPDTTRAAWLWLIPFSDGTASLGVVATPEILQQWGDDPADILHGAIAATPELANLLAAAEFHQPVQTLRNYSANVTTLHGQGFALLGNASEFLDPVFSSGVTIALVSAQQAVATLLRQWQGENVDWARDYAAPLGVGVQAFKTYVLGWYDGRFQDVIFSRDPNPDIRAMIAAILAGYAWDENNPYVSQPERRLNALAEVVRGQA